MLKKFDKWMKRLEHKLSEHKLVRWGFCQNY